MKIKLNELKLQQLSTDIDDARGSYQFKYALLVRQLEALTRTVTDDSRVVIQQIPVCLDPQFRRRNFPQDPHWMMMFRPARRRVVPIDASAYYTFRTISKIPMCKIEWSGTRLLSAVHSLGIYDQQSISYNFEYNVGQGMIGKFSVYAKKMYLPQQQQLIQETLMRFVCLRQLAVRDMRRLLNLRKKYQHTDRTIQNLRDIANNHFQSNRETTALWSNDSLRIVNELQASYAAIELEIMDKINDLDKVVKTYQLLNGDENVIDRYHQDIIGFRAQHLDETHLSSAYGTMFAYPIDNSSEKYVACPGSTMQCNFNYD